MANTACTETAAIRLDGSLADSTTIRFADEEVSAAPPGSKESIACAVFCIIVLETPVCFAICVYDE